MPILWASERVFQQVLQADKGEQIHSARNNGHAVGFLLRQHANSQKLSATKDSDGFSLKEIRLAGIFLELIGYRQFHPNHTSLHPSIC